MEGVFRQSRGYRPEHRKSGESPHSQARKRIGLRERLQLLTGRANVLVNLDSKLLALAS